MADYQGGKKFRQLKEEQEKKLDEINRNYLDDPDYGDSEDYPDLTSSLETYKQQFIEFDLDSSGDIDLMELKMMMENMGQAKTHLELKKMIAEVDRENRGSISYNDFLFMMLGKKSSVLKLILKFEQKANEEQQPSGVAPKRDISSLP